MGCSKCETDLAQVRADLKEIASVRDRLLVIVDAAMHVMTPDQRAEVRQRIKEHDSGPGSAV